jgi:hypothetical protein
MNLRPDLLQHPVIPPPLHGLAPRTLLGQKWWDTTRKAAYAANDDCCWSCGTHKSKTWYRKYLEGHEAYEIDYDACTVVLKEIVGLCHSCHNFIHVGRLLKQYEEGIVTDNYVRNVLDWGITTLAKADLKPNFTQGYHWLILKKYYTADQAMYYALKAGLAQDKFNPGTWDLWKIVIDGKEYQGKSKPEWLKDYS